MADAAHTLQAPGAAPVMIKKYANRRLYNTSTSSYVTLEHLCQMVKDGVDFAVHDAKTGEDITRQVLTQIIVEEEGKGQNLLPISFMRKLIGFYGGSMQWALPTYLDQSIQAFARNQEQMREYLSKSMGGMFPFGALNQMGKQNLAMMEQAMKMFAPFSGQGEAGQADAGQGATGQAETQHTAKSSNDIEDLRRRLEELEREISGLGRSPKP
jgi:polyhydroxyalkanoate synthesis repressor PhaR